MTKKWLKGFALREPLLAFAPSLLGREQVDYDPLNGLRKYGPYKDVDVQILHVIPREYSMSREEVMALNEQLQKIMGHFLKETRREVKVENLEISSIVSSGFDARINDEILSSVEGKKDYVILVPLPERILGKAKAQRIYAQLKALGLENGFVTQMYAEKTIESIRSLIHTRTQFEIREIERRSPILLNLALNIFAKAGGKPWALSDRLEYDFVVGLGWSVKRIKPELSTGPNIKYYGVVHTFNNVGTWETFDAFSCEAKEEELSTALSESLDYIIADKLKIKMERRGRILILTRENLGPRAMGRLSKFCDSLGYDLDIAMVSSTKPTRIYVISNSYLIPRGLGFLISEEEAYIATTGEARGRYTGIGVPQPILIRLLSSTSKTREKTEILERIVRAVYSFTVMNWRSLWGTLRLPTPIHYSKLVADVFARITLGDINMLFGKRETLMVHENIRDIPWFI